MLGFGFLPADGWRVVQSGSIAEIGTANAIAANGPLDAADASEDMPIATLRRLPVKGALIVTRFAPRGDQAEDSRFPLRTLPLRIADAVPTPLPQALSDTPLAALHLRAGVGGYNVDARIFVMRQSPAALAAADEQLRRLVVAPGSVTLVVQPRLIRNRSQRMSIFGSVSNARAGQKVVIQFRACGLYPLQFRDAFETTTREGGGFSLAELQPFNLGVSGVFRAVSGDSVSAPVSVQQQANPYLWARGGGRFQAGVSAMVPFWRRYVLLQRYERARGRWLTVRRLVLVEQLGGAGGPAPPFARQNPVTVRTENFRPGFPRGTRIRVVFPLSQAKPCYTAGVSETRRT